MEPNNNFSYTETINPDGTKTITSHGRKEYVDNMWCILQNTYEYLGVIKSNKRTTSDDHIKEVEDTCNAIKDSLSRVISGAV